MAWQDRIRPAAYRSPTGTRIEFQYENVSFSFDKRTTAFDFPDTQGTYVQDLGRTGRKYPFNVIFWGDDYDIRAAQFEDMLGETGIGVLEHPVYGVKNVIPFGTITRRDDLKTAGNQAIYQVTFWETLDLVFPNPQTSPTDDVVNAVDAYNDAEADAYGALTDFDTVAKQANAINRVRALLNTVKANLQAVADTVASVQKTFDAIFESVNTAIDILISTPITMATQITALIQTPARATAAINARLIAYKSLADSTIKDLSNAFNVYAPDSNSENSNNFHTDDLNAMGFMTGSILAVVNNQFETATAALDAADSLVTQYDELIEWRDLNFDSLGEIDTGEAYQQLQDAYSTAVGYLIQISFTLKQERSIILTYPRTVLDLVAELYGEIDSQLDFFIESNQLTGSEILEIPAGREIKFYV